MPRARELFVRQDPDQKSGAVRGPGVATYPLSGAGSLAALWINLIV